MTRYFSVGLISLLFATGCAGTRTNTVDGEQGPALSIRVYQQTSADSKPTRMTAESVLGPRESPLLELEVDRSVNVSAVLFSAEGTSQELSGTVLDAASDRHKTVRMSVPRLAPPGVSETELRVVIAASKAPISAQIRQLLRLPCSDPDRRGDPEPEKSKEQKPAAGGRSSGGSSASNGRPPEGGPRGGGMPEALCQVSPGLAQPVTVHTLLLRSR